MKTLNMNGKFIDFLILKKKESKINIKSKILKKKQLRLFKKISSVLDKIC